MKKFFEFLVFIFELLAWFSLAVLIMCVVFVAVFILFFGTLAILYS